MIGSNRWRGGFWGELDGSCSLASRIFANFANRSVHPRADVLLVRQSVLVDAPRHLVFRQADVIGAIRVDSVVIRRIRDANSQLQTHHANRHR
jgi:hypothetical protein